MADVQSNIEVNLDASQALGQLKALQRQLANFHASVATTSSAAAKAQANLQSNLINSVNATGKFSAGLTTIKSSADSFTDSLERNKFSTREYFRYAGGATKTFSRLFKQEYDTIGKVSEERLKTMQTQYIKMGRTANGAIQSIAIRPLALDMDHLATRTAIAAQKQQLFGQLLKQGSTNLLNFGKNTQWAGRQLMVGFTVPLTMLGSTAGKTFMELEKQAVRFKRVYGEMFTTSGETEKALKEIELLAKSFTKYGIAVEKTMEMAADAAASGKMGAELMAQVAEATRLAVLGGVEQEDALKTTISLTNAFGIAADKLKQKIDFLNAVENQTVLNIEDLTIAVPKAGPVIRQLGGDVEDLAFFMTAMKEGGINASEGANALKSGLASLINPSKKASAFLLDLGVNINGIVESNKGNIKDTVVQFAQALDTLAPLERSRAIEQLFGKFQFSRLSTLFQNITKDGTQASRTLSLAGASVEELAILSERELAKVENATGTKFKKSIEGLKLALAPVGEQFLKALTPIVEFFGRILEKFNGLGEGSKKAIVVLIGAVGLIGPALLMTFGLIANGAANIIKLFLTLRNGFLGLGKESKFLGNQTRYMSSEQIEAAAIATALNQSHSRLTQTFTAEAASANALAAAYQKANIAGANFARLNPGMMKGGLRPKKFGDGGWVPGTGNQDTVPAVLTPGEFVVTKDAAQENKGFLQRLNKGGFVLRGDGTGGNPYAGEIKGGPRYDPTLPRMRPGSIEYAKALVEKQKKAMKDKALFLGMPNSNKEVQGIRNQDAVLDLIDDEIKNSNLDKLRPKNFGKLVAESSGRSFPVPGIGGIYEKPDGSKVFVKPVLDEKSALAEMRGTTIARDVHGLVSPEQKLSTMIDPNNSKRRLIVLESNFDPRFAAMSGEFTKSDFIKQAVASVVRGDKDLSKSNLSGNVLADVGPAGVFGAASGKRNFGGMLPVKDQAMVNFLGVKGGAKRYFADATRSIAQSMTAAQYEKAMIQELDRVLPKLKSSIGSFNLNPEEKVAYSQMVQRVEDAKKINWKEIHKVHAEGKTQNIKKPTTKPIQKPGERGHRVSIKDPAFRKLLVARGFKLRGKPVGDSSILKPGGVAGTVELHYGDALSGPQPTHVSGRLAGVRKNAGYTMLGDQGYNQLTIGSKKLGLPEPYPLTFSDAKKSEKILQDSLNNPIGKTSQAQIRMRTIALTQLQQDMKTIGERGWKNAMAQRTALAAAYSEKEKYPPAGSTYKAIYKAFQSSPGIDTQSLRNAYLKKVDSLWENGLLTDINRRNRGKISGKGTQHSALGVRGGQNLATMMQDTMATTKNNKTFVALRSLLNVKSGGIDPSGVTAKALALQGFKFAIRRNGGGSVPGYGEKDTVPALLTPGEFVVNKAATQEHGPILQAMNAGEVEYKATGTTRSQTKQQRKIKIQEELNRREYQAQLKIKADEIRAQRAYSSTGSNIGLGGTDSPEAQKQEAKRMNTQKMMQRSSMLMSATYAASAALNMMGNDIAQKVQPALGALTVATTAMTMIQGPGSALAVGITALVGTYYFLNEKAKNQAIATSKMVDVQNATTEKMKEIGNITGKVGASELYSRKREKNSSDTFTTGFERAGQQFGTSILESDVGKNILESFKKSLSTDGKVAVKQLGTQLATYVSDGLMSPEQARSFARAIGINMSDMTITSQINGQLREIIGPDGTDLLKEPLTVRLKIVEANKLDLKETTKLLENYQTSVQGFNDAFIDSIKTEFTELPQEKLAATAAAMGAQALEATQSQIDAQNQMYDKQINVLQKQKETTKDKKKQEEIDSQINNLLEKRKNDEQAIRGQAKEILKMQLKAYDTVLKGPESSGARQAFFEGLKNQVKTKAKEQGQEVFGDVLLSKTKDLKSKKLEVEINTIVGSGMLTSLSATKMLDIFAGKEDILEKTFSALLTAQDPGKVGELFNILSSFQGKGSKETALKIATEISAKGQEKNFDKRLNALNNLQLLDGKEVNLAAYLKVDGVKKLDELARLMGIVEDLPNPLTKKAVLNLESNIGMPEMDAIIANWEFYAKLPNDLRKTAVQTFTAISKTIGTKEISDFQKEQLAKAGPMSARATENFVKNNSTKSQVAEALNRELYPEGGYTKTPPGGKGKGGGTGTKDSPYNDTLKRLKLVQNSKIDAVGGAPELKRVMGPAASITQFKGIDQKLMADGKVSRDFLDFVDAMSPEGLQKDLADIATGAGTASMKLTTLGNALNKAFTAIKLGEYQTQLTDRIAGIKNQVGAMSVLRNAGFSYAEAMELASDQTLALAIANKELSPDQLKELKNQTEQLTTAQKQYDNAQKIALMDEMDGQVARFNIVEKFVALQEKLIENQYVLEQSKLEKKQNDNNYNLDLISRQEDKINEVYDKQIKSLEEINALAEKNNALTSAKMSIADALAQGDISAASSAMQEYRNAKIQQVAKTRMEALQKAKTNAIASVTSPNGLTRVQIEKDNKVIADRLSDITNNIRLAKDKLDISLKDTLGLTRVEIAAAGSAIKLALEAGIDPNDSKFLGKILQGVKGDAESTILALTGVAKSIKEANDQMIAAKAELRTKDDKQFADQIEKDKADKAAAAAAYEAAKAAAASNAANVSNSNAANSGTPGVLEGINQAAETAAVEKFLADEKFRQDAIDKTQGFAPGKSREERDAQLAKDAEIVNKLYEKTNALKIQQATNEYEYQQRLAELESTKTRDNYQLVKISLLKDMGLDTKGLDPKSSDWINWIDESVAEERAKIGTIEKSLMSLYGSMGGVVPKYMASGGMARGTDTVPAMLTPGEFIVNKKATQSFGPLLSAINSPTFTTPEAMSSIKNLSGSQTEVNNSKTLYNYNLSVNVSNSNANPNDIARTVINQIKQIDNQRIRSL